MVQPSKPGYSLAAADLARFNITPRDAASLIAQATEGRPQGLNAEPGDLIGALLAELVRSQKRFNATFMPLAFSLPVYTRQQILAQNPLRAYLMVQNVGSGDLILAFESGEVSPTDLSGATSELTNQQQRSLRIVAGGYYEPLVAPQNPITIFTLNTATSGVIIEGN